LAALSKATTSRVSPAICALHAVTRCLEIISEASRRIPQEVKVRHPSLPWRQMADAGNKYRHEYEDVAERVVRATVQDALPPLLHAIRVERGPDE